MAPFFLANTISVLLRRLICTPQSYISSATHWSCDPDLSSENHGVRAEKFWGSFACLVLTSLAPPFFFYWKNVWEASWLLSGNQGISTIHEVVCCLEWHINRFCLNGEYLTSCTFGFTFIIENKQSPLTWANTSPFI